MVKDLLLEGANPTAKKAPAKKAKLVATKAKKTTTTVSKTLKASSRAKKTLKSPVKRAAFVPAVRVVVSPVAVTKRSNRVIRLPQRYVEKN